MTSMASVSASVARADGGQLLGHVDPDRAPRDAPPAADAPGAAELVVPGAELVRQPLTVTGARGRPYRAAVDVRVVDREAGVPASHALGVIPGHVGHVLDARAEARRADERAVAAGEAARSDLVPPLVPEIPGEEVADVGRVEPAPHALRGAVDRGPGRGQVRGGRRPAIERGEHVGAALAADLDQVAVLALEDLGQREVVAHADPRPGLHRHAEAGSGRLVAVGGDDEGILAARCIVLVGDAAAHEHAILDLDRVELAGPDADQRERRRRLRLVLEGEAGAFLTVRPPEPDAWWQEELLPRVRTDGEAEPRVVVSFFEPVGPRVLGVGPADR